MPTPPFYKTGNAVSMTRVAFHNAPSLHTVDFNRRILSGADQAGMNGDAFSIKAPKECSEKLAATLRGKSLPEETF